MKPKIIYEDVSPLAKIDSSEYTSTDKKEYVDMSDLKSEIPTYFPNYALCLPRYSKIGEYNNSPNTIPTSGLGYVSNSISSSNRTFTSNPKIERLFTQKHSSVGISIGFNQYSGDYCDLINIKWYEDNVLLYDMDFEPNSTYYFCEKNVENFNKLIIEFKRTSKPQRYIWVGAIDYGTTRVYENNEAKNIKTLNEISQISEELTINTMDFKLFSLRDVDFLFQKTQAMKLYADDVLMGTYYIDTAKRTANNQYDIKTKDAIGILAEQSYMGGMYNNVLASTIIADIFNKCNLKYKIEQSLANKTITGYIPIMTCRDTLTWICMAIGAVVNTAYSEKTVIKSLETEVKRTINTHDQFTGASIETLSKVTGVSVEGYRYTTSNESVELFNDTLNDTITVQFGEPIHSLSITNGAIIESNVNYAVIKGTGTTVLSGKRYNVSAIVSSKINPSLGALDLQNIVQLKNVNIINSSNIVEVRDRIYNYYLNNKRINTKIIVGENKLGDKVNVDTLYEGAKTGIIERMSTTYTNSLASEVVIR